ncbi:MAG: NAD-dependent malic enzyme [Gammaproteobacteria bacterium]|nr:NAD-dependent malic enzyme [Gammaproteobacteria bacterium]
MSDEEIKGVARLRDVSLTKGTAFSLEERERFGLRGLLPAEVCTQEVQVERTLANMRRKAYDIERYIFLASLQDRNERLFYQTLLENIEEIMPLIYTPTVGQACKEFAHIFRQARGFYITVEDRGSIREILRNWPESDIRMIVVTDGERILGLGDLGANGMGIPLGKLALYVGCAGIQPSQCLPVMLDVGTNNEALREDPLYLGRRTPRVSGAAYDDLVEEFVDAVRDAYPKALIQFEDFLTPNAYRLLHKYRQRVLCFNDDIQGTAAVALAGLQAATRLSGVEFTQQRIMFLGAGSAATGIADLITVALIEQGLSPDEARARLTFVDREGLLNHERNDLAPHNRPYVHQGPSATFPEAIDAVQPHVLVGATGAPGTFTQAVLVKMAQINPRPVIFALSNPTSQAECTADQAYTWTKGKAIFASGSPFAPVHYDGQEFEPGQGNNAYVFPGIGLGAIAVEASEITDKMFLAAADALSDMVSNDDLIKGRVYPPLSHIRDVSVAIATAVAQSAFDEGLAGIDAPTDLKAFIENQMYWPDY